MSGVFLTTPNTGVARARGVHPTQSCGGACTPAEPATFGPSAGRCARLPATGAIATRASTWVSNPSKCLANSVGGPYCAAGRQSGRPGTWTGVALRIRHRNGRSMAANQYVRRRVGARRQRRPPRTRAVAGGLEVRRWQRRHRRLARVPQQLELEVLRRRELAVVGRPTPANRRRLSRC